MSYILLSRRKEENGISFKIDLIFIYLDWMIILLMTFIILFTFFNSRFVVEVRVWNPQSTNQVLTNKFIGLFKKTKFPNCRHRATLVIIDRQATSTQYKKVKSYCVNHPPLFAY